MIKDYYNKLQESEILNLLDNEEKQNIYNDNNSKYIGIFFFFFFFFSKNIKF